ncbi:MAG: glycosyltransferase, partial [Lachnospiraceae bacterium]|nr:glycosyltransferase [Lachnospiraceae bacterium]
MSKISIIVVCLNPGNKLIETMESILRQTFKDYEVVVKDGFSKDGSID